MPSAHPALFSMDMGHKSQRTHWIYCSCFHCNHDCCLYQPTDIVKLNLLLQVMTINESVSEDSHCKQLGNQNNRKINRIQFLALGVNEYI